MPNTREESAAAPGPHDVLSLFEPEQRASSSSTRETPPVTPGAPEEAPSAFVAQQFSPTEATDRHAEVGATGEPGLVSLDRLIEAAAPLRFVDGVALVQALGAALKDKAGIHAGMPDTRGVFLTASGDIVVLTQPTGEPGARELARLLHRLVPSEATPPVGRLFVDRWSTGTSSDLSEFSSELAYFARPNGRDLLKAIHARCSGAAEPVPVVTPSAPPALVIPPAQTASLEQVPPVRATAPELPHVSWLQSHRRHIFAAAAVVAATVVATGLVTWFWPSPAAQAAQAANVATPTEESAPVEADVEPDAPAPASTSAAKDIPLRPATPRVRSTRPAAGAVASAPVSTDETSGTAAASSPVAPDGPTPGGPFTTPAYAGPVAPLLSRVVPDLRIYSASDSDIDPPRLRSPELVEGLISGFETRQNQVEVIVSQSGEVERVRMLGPPQRIPDVMLLSRMKEWNFEPATKEGAAVRYRLVLSWNVTP